MDWRWFFRPTNTRRTRPVRRYFNKINQRDTSRTHKLFLKKTPGSNHEPALSVHTCKAKRTCYDLFTMVGPCRKIFPKFGHWTAPKFNKTHLTSTNPRGTTVTFYLWICPPVSMMKQPRFWPFEYREFLLKIPASWCGGGWSLCFILTAKVLNTATKPKAHLILVNFLSSLCMEIPRHDVPTTQSMVVSSSPKRW